MFTFFKRTRKSVSTDLEEIRKRNNEAIQELLEKNRRLEKKRDLRNPKKVMKAEMELSKECERQIRKLNLEADKWNAKEEKLMYLDRRRNELFRALERTNEQLIEKPVLKSYLSGAKEQQKSLKLLNTRLANHVNILTDQLSYQTKVFDKYTKSADGNKNLMKIQENCITEIMDKLEIFNLAALNDKTMAKDENLDHLDKQNNSLLQKLESLKQQLVGVPVMRYHYRCAKKECQRLTQLNPKLEKLVQDLTDELSYQTALERDYKEADDLIKELEETKQNYLYKIEDLKSMVKLGIKSKKKDKDNMAKRLTSLVLKLDDLKKEFVSFQLDIENILGNIQSFNVVNIQDRIRPADDQKFTGQHSNLAGEWKQISLDSILSDGECVPPTRENQGQNYFLESEDEASDKELEDSSLEETTTEDDLVGLNNTTVKESDSQDRQRLRKNEKQVDTSESEDETSDEESEDSTLEDTTSEDDLTESYSTAINESFPQALQRERENKKQEKISESEDETSDEELEDTTSEDDSTDLCNTPVKESDPQDLQGLRGNKKQDFSESVDKASDKELQDRTTENTMSEDNLTESYNATAKDSDPQNLQGQRENEKQLDFSESVDKTCDKDFEDRTLENTTSQDNSIDSRNPTVKESDPQDLQGLRENGKQDFSESEDKIHDKELEDRTLEDTRFEDDLTDSHNTTVKESDSPDLQRLEKKGKQEDFAKAEDKTSDKEIEESPLEDMTFEDNLTDSQDTSLKESDCLDSQRLRDKHQESTSEEDNTCEDRDHSEL